LPTPSLLPAKVSKIRVLDWKFAQACRLHLPDIRDEICDAEPVESITEFLHGLPLQERLQSLVLGVRARAIEFLTRAK